MLSRLFSVAILSFLFFTSCKKTTQESHSSTGESDHLINLQLVSTEDSGIDFQNTLTHNLSTNENLFNFDYFYNGAGVGIADLNNDDLPDIFFCGNQVKNKLYLNRGDLKFEDISETSGIQSNKGWTNGVTFADVNQDGWLDIYLSQGGPIAGEARKNLLFINQKNNQFKESAATYGLADKNISTQSVFFDADQDGDLDCFVMNESENYGLPPIPFFQKTMSDPAVTQKNSSHFFRNDNGRFNNVTAEVGMLWPSFGLGVAVTDFNEDGWLDLYIANDYYVPDALYINNKKGGFVESIKKYTSHQSFFAMGMDIADINNDGLQDIFVLDMAASDHVRSKTLMASMSTDNFDLLTKSFEFPYQYMFNSFQLNKGKGHYNNVAHLTGTAKTDWSWTVLLADFNNNSQKDIYVTNGYRRYALDNDTRTAVQNARKKYNGKVPMTVKAALYDKMPSEKLPNVLFQNQGNLNFKLVEEGKDLRQPSFSNGAGVADLDNDGDLDLVINNMDGPAFLYQNKSTGNFLKIKITGATSETFAQATIYYDDKQQMQENRRVRGYLSTSSDILHFGLGTINKIDSLVVQWPEGGRVVLKEIQTNQTLTIDRDKSSSRFFAKNKFNLFEKKSLGALNLVFRHMENDYNDFATEILLPYKQSTLGPCLSQGDLNGDQLPDIFIGGSAGFPARIFIQDEDGYKKVKSPALISDAANEDADAIFFDYDQDGDQDLYVVSGGNEFSPENILYQDRLYENDGRGNLTKVEKGFLDAASGKSVISLDFDKDGDLDLLVGNRIKPQHYPTAAPSVLYENKGKSFEKVTDERAADLLSFGIINDLVATDLNQDGWTDFIAVGEWTGIGIFINEEGSFTQIQNEDLIDKKGWWFSVNETDINQDGLPDFIVGNLGKNSKYKASTTAPLRIYGNDFDDNGTFDIVLSTKYKDDYVPFRGRECSSQQMPFIEEKFTTYQSFANASLEDVYGSSLGESYSREANSFTSILLVNQGDGKFVSMDLPILAQTFPILDVAFSDFDNDGIEDALLVGNIFDTEVETPRLDGGNGLLLLTDPIKGMYTVAPNQNFYLSGNIKLAEILEVNNEKYLLTLKNNDLPELHQIQERPKKEDYFE